MRIQTLDVAPQQKPFLPLNRDEAVTGPIVPVAILTTAEGVVVVVPLAGVAATPMLVA